MARPANAISTDVAKRAKSLGEYIARMERLRQLGEIQESDLSKAYEGAFLAFHTYLERSIEKLFMGILMERLAVSGPTLTPIVSIRSEAVAKKAVCGDRSYVDWLPYRYTKNRARAFLPRGIPFNRLSKQDVKVFERASIIRNAIAHDSAHSLHQFHETFGIVGLPPSQRRPVGFLRGQQAVGLTRFEFVLAECTQVMAVLCK